MKTVILLLKIVGWILLAFVGLKVVSATYLAIHNGSPVGEAFAQTLMRILDFDEPKDQVFFSAFVLGVAFLFKGRFISKMLKTKDTNQ